MFFFFVAALYCVQLLSEYVLFQLFQFFHEQY